MKHHLLTRILVIWSLFLTACLVMLLAASFWFYVLDTPHPIVFNNLPFPVSRESYRPGDTVEYIVDRCRNTEQPATFTTTLVGPTKVFFWPQLSGISTTGCTVATVQRQLPAELLPGTYTIEGRSDFQVNSFALRSVPWMTVEFEVTP